MQFSRWPSGSPSTNVGSVLFSVNFNPPTTHGKNSLDSGSATEDEWVGSVAVVCSTTASGLVHSAFVGGWEVGEGNCSNPVDSNALAGSKWVIGA